MIPKATLRHYSRHPVRGRVYPGVVPTPGSVAAVEASSTTHNLVEGVVLLGVTPLEMQCLDYFEDEGVDYTRSTVQVRLPHQFDKDCQQQNDKGLEEQAIQSHAYIWSLGESKLDSSCGWDYDAFVEEHLEWYLETTVKPIRVEIENTIL
eukprot:CAMPEP_0172530622 /NCGR_PEP_ID=MMETSP1067-20121228/4301_1 /TAXON_ID=265564 ORGANISM="Thalassiosira punctigera, Strain Tpunct2005C2" /NCGR_SAMPLE_ID=MMETSP1067 /ASSEMBLY_ACC=CAM_ASM_000444 /LENGTH=149 /DNA_ID=CAMNT_0013314867 /DNA_START=314 /DNA_END=763 /DNA_ORIENTATION=+